MKLYIGGIAFDTTEAQLASFFAPYGKTEDVKIIKDRETDKSKGFGFVSMADDEAAKAIVALDQSLLGDRTVTVRKARPKKVGPDAPSMSLTGDRPHQVN